jgi:subtilisin
VRWDFGSDGFTTTVNGKQYQALLKNKNLKIEEVPEVTLETTVEATPKPGAGAAALPSDQTPWGIEAIYNDSSIQTPSGGDNVKVAVLDTGVHINHRDLAGSAEQCKDFTQRNSPLVNGSWVTRTDMAPPPVTFKLPARHI